MSGSPLHIGILADTEDKQALLTKLVSHAGHQLGYKLLLTSDDLAAVNSCPTSNTAADIKAPDNQPIDAWVIDLADDYYGQNTRVEQLFAHSHVPIILSDSSEFPAGSDQYEAWFKRSVQRLQRLHSDINLNTNTAATELWVLAASTGGPAAVKRFLARLPANLDIAFLYVQHVDANQLPTLNRMMSNAGHYPALLATSGAVLARNCVMIASARDHFDVLDNGTLKVNYNQKWLGSYAPSIDQVVANVARIYRARSGLIIFTGMGDDGAASGRLIKQLGGQFWVQTPSDCTSDSMPISALATGCVSLSGTPEELADALSRRAR